MDNFTYSVDMVRLQTEVKRTIFNEVMKKFTDSSLCSMVDYLELKSIKAYRHNFNIKGMLEPEQEFILYDIDSCDNPFQRSKSPTYSFWIGAEHNAKSPNKNNIDVVIEYNPNKCKDSQLLKYVLDNLFIKNKLTKIKKIDFAIDIPENIQNIKLIRDFRSSYKYFDNGGDDITHYMRKRNSHGHLKIYNKKRESNLDYELTRYEVTIIMDIDLRMIDIYKVDYGIFPDLMLLEEQQLKLEKINGTDKVLLLSVMEHPEYLKLITRDKRKKIEGLMETFYKKITFNGVNKIEETIINYFKSILN